MTGKNGMMSDSITDGLQYDDWLNRDIEPADEDEAYERLRQQGIDAKIAPSQEKRA